jgi:hypothetical protein
VGRVVRLELLTEADLPEMHLLLGDPRVYAQGYVMHQRPFSLQDAVDLARERFLVQQGQADGSGGGRTAYAARLVADSDLGAAGASVGTSSLLEFRDHDRLKQPASVSQESIGDAIDAGSWHIVLGLPAPYPADAARWVTDELSGTAVHAGTAP